jgi:beta-lactamase regulating signal transducer with metallopeptidase domain
MSTTPGVLALFDCAQFEPLCRATLEIGLTAVIRSVLPIALGLLGLWAARDRGVEVRRGLVNASLASATTVLILSLLCTGLPNSVPSIFRIGIPGIATNAAATAAPEVVASRSTPPLVDADLFGIEAGRPAAEQNRSAYSDSGRNQRATSVHEDPVSPPVVALTILEPKRIHPATGNMGLVIEATVACWCAGSAGFLLLLLVSTAAVASIVRRGRAIEDGPTLAFLEDLCARKDVCPPRMVACRNVLSPFVTGIRHSTLVMPASYVSDYEPDALRAILTHEVTHLAQRDCLWTLVGRILCAFCWPIPLVWALCRQREALSEESCDVEVLRSGCSPTLYARCLLALAERLRPLRPERVAGVGALTVRSGLGRRIERILSGVRVAQAPLAHHTRLMLAFAAIAITVPSMILVGQAAPREPQAPDHAATTPASPVTATQSGSSLSGNSPQAEQANARPPSAELRARRAVADRKALAEHMARAITAYQLAAVAARRQAVEVRLHALSASDRRKQSARALRLEQRKLQQAQAGLREALLALRRQQQAQAAIERAQRRDMVDALARQAAAQRAQREVARALQKQASRDTERAAAHRQASASILAATADVQSARAAVAAQEAQVKQAEAAITTSQAELNRLEANLATLQSQRQTQTDPNSRSATTAAVQSAQSALAAQVAELHQEQAAVAVAQANLNVRRANLAALQNQLRAEQAVSAHNAQIAAAQNAQANLTVQAVSRALEAAVAAATSKVRSAEATLRSARAELIDLQIHYNRMVTLHKQGYVAAQDVDEARAQLAEQQAAVDQAQAELSVRQANLAALQSQLRAQRAARRTKPHGGADATSPSRDRVGANRLHEPAQAQEPASAGPSLRVSWDGSVKNYYVCRGPVPTGRYLVLGRTGRDVVVGNRLAAETGNGELVPGDVLVGINGLAVTTWSDAIAQQIALPTVTVTVRRTHEAQLRTMTLWSHRAGASQPAD